MVYWGMGVFQLSVKYRLHECASILFRVKSCVGCTLVDSLYVCVWLYTSASVMVCILCARFNIAMVTLLCVLIISLYCSISCVGWRQLSTIRRSS